MQIAGRFVVARVAVATAAFSLLLTDVSLAMPRALPTFSPCSVPSSQFSLGVTPGNPLVFKASEPKVLPVELVNHGADARVVSNPLIYMIELHVASEDGRSLQRDEHESSFWGRSAGGSNYFAANAKIRAAIPMDRLVPQTNGPGLYDVTVIWHLYFRQAEAYGCVQSASVRVTVTDG